MSSQHINTAVFLQVFWKLKFWECLIDLDWVNAAICLSSSYSVLPSPSSSQLTSPHHGLKDETFRQSCLWLHQSKREMTQSTELVESIWFTKWQNYLWFTLRLVVKSWWWMVKVKLLKFMMSLALACFLGAHTFHSVSLDGILYFSRRLPGILVKDIVIISSPAQCRNPSTASFSFSGSFY